MKILFLVSSMHAGGAERVAATLATAWAEHGDCVTLVPTYTKKGSCFYKVSPKVDIIWLADLMAGPRWPGVSTLSKWRALRRLVRQKQPELIISFLTNVNIVALLATRGLNVPLIVCERTDPSASSAGRLLKRLRRHLYPWASLVVVQTQASAVLFKKMIPGIRALAVLANPLPPELLDSPRATRVGDTQGRRRLVAMGRLVTAKQFDRLIEAFSGLAHHYPDWDLLIWGEGPERGALTGQIQQAGLTARIMLPGRTEAPWHELARSDAFALTSAVEGFPNVLLEAMALGLPCIAFDCPSGPREISRDGQDALLVPAGDQAALVAGLRRLFDDASLRDELADRAVSVRQLYALPQVMKAWDAAIRKTGLRRLPAQESND